MLHVFNGTKYIFFSAEVLVPADNPPKGRDPLLSLPLYKPSGHRVLRGLPRVTLSSEYFVDFGNGLYMHCTWRVEDH